MDSDISSSESSDDEDKEWKANIINYDHGDDLDNEEIDD